jgi:hypothetical protein
LLYFPAQAPFFFPRQEAIKNRFLSILQKEKPLIERISKRLGGINYAATSVVLILVSGGTEA